MEIIRYDRYSYGIHADYSNALREIARGTPGMQWDGTKRAWVGWPDAVRACARRLQKETTLEVEGKLPSRKYTARVIDPALTSDLRGYQKVGVDFLVRHASGGALLADDLGLGKTVQTCRSLMAFRKDAVVVCPMFVRDTWLREIKKWMGDDVRVIELDGTKPKRPVCPVPCEIYRGKKECPAHGSEPCPYCSCAGRQTIYLVHYDIVYAWTDVLRESTVKALVLDEIQMLQSADSRRSQSCRSIAMGCKYRIGLSGTPMTNRPADLWNPIDVLSPGRFGRDWDFYRRYCDAKQITIETRSQGQITVWNKDGASHLKELRSRLKFFMLHRTKSDVRMELPPRTRQMVGVTVAKNYQALPSKAIKGSKKWLRRAFAIAADGKIPQAVDLIESHVRNGSKVVVYSHRKVVAELVTAMLMKKKIDARTITGKLNRRQRTKFIDERHDVLSCTMDSVQVGIDLSYADVAVFVELDYVPSKLLQCEGRVYRFGQKKRTLVQYVIAKDTADETVRDAVLLKLENFEKVIGETDDELEEDLAATKLSTPKQLRSLAMKVKEQSRKWAA